MNGQQIGDGHPQHRFKERPTFTYLEDYLVMTRILYASMTCGDAHLNNNNRHFLNNENYSHFHLMKEQQTNTIEE